MLLKFIHKLYFESEYVKRPHSLQYNTTHNVDISNIRISLFLNVIPHYYFLIVNIDTDTDTDTAKRE